MDKLRNEGVHLIGRIMNIHKNTKINLAMKCSFTKVEDETIKIYHNFQLNFYNTRKE